MTSIDPLRIYLYDEGLTRYVLVLLLSSLVVGSFSRPQQEQHNYEMDLQGGRGELMDIENVSSTGRNSPTTI